MSDQDATQDKQQETNLPSTQEELDRIIQARVASKNRRIQELETEAAQARKDRDDTKGQLEERDQTISTLQSDVASRDRTILVNEVAAAKHVPAKYLTGDSREDLEASADEFLSDIQAYVGSSDAGGQEQSGEAGGSGGYVPSAGTGEETPPRPDYDELKRKAYESAMKQKGMLL